MFNQELPGYGLLGIQHFSRKSRTVQFGIHGLVHVAKLQFQRLRLVKCFLFGQEKKAINAFSVWVPPKKHQGVL